MGDCIIAGRWGAAFGCTSYFFNKTQTCRFFVRHRSQTGVDSRGVREGMGANGGCKGDLRVVDCETTPRDTGLRPIVVELRMPFSPEAGGNGVPGMLDPRMVDGHAYVEALAREVLASAPDYADCQVQAVALTDGMAAHVADDVLGALLRDIRQSFNLVPGAEIALRVRPGMVAAASVDAFRIGHVSRIVMDYATSSLREWRALSRALDPSAMDVTRMVLGALPECGHGVRLADREADLAFELLVGIPGQTPVSARSSVEAALAYGASEVRLEDCEPTANLTVPASAATRTLSTEEAGRVREAMHETLAAAGFVEYLPERWALPGHESRYETLMATGATETLGFGLGARTLFDGVEARNTSELSTYLRFSDDPEKCVATVRRVG